MQTERNELERRGNVSLLALDEANETERGYGNLESRQAVNPKVILEELFELLEEYGPAWYTEDHHRRAVAALLMP